MRTPSKAIPAPRERKLEFYPPPPCRHSNNERPTYNDMDIVVSIQYNIFCSLFLFLGGYTDSIETHEDTIKSHTGPKGTKT